MADAIRRSHQRTARVQEDRAAVEAVSASVARPFRAVVFDWDGTAVVDRREDATALAALVEELARAGVWIVVVTGTRFDHVDRQLCQRIAPAARRHLLVCANRGSEVYGFDRRGRAVQRWLRVATPAEEQALTDIAEGVRDALAAVSGLEIRIIYDRLNRRKIDLIPLPEWADPPKARIGQLLVAVESRLRSAGIAGGLGAAIDLAARLAREKGLPNARITSDVKHVEVGLTDKGDSLAWVRQHIFMPRGVDLRDVLIVGDEFGPVAGFAGSDDRLRQEAGGAVVVSVGAEPNGVPAGVIHLPGGAARFRALLAEQVRLHRAEAPRRESRRLTPLSAIFDLPAAADWRLEESGYRPALEHEIESRFALGNGLLGVRASLEQPTTASRPATLVAGLFGLSDGQPPIPALVPGPNWSRLRIALDGEPLSIDHVRPAAHPRTLDLARGMLVSDWSLRDHDQRVGRLRTIRLVSLARRSIAAQLVQVDVDRPGWVDLELPVDAPRERLRLVRAEPGLLVWKPSSGRRYLGMAVAAARVDGRTAWRLADSSLGTRWSWTATPGHPATFARLVSVARAETADGAARAARAALQDARRRGLSRVLEAHTRAWARRWAAADVEVEGDDEARRALRFAVYHLVSAANPEDELVSIGARALTGEAYLGHVFWDTEIFLVPFYAFTWPEAARALLMYRYRTLPAARARAAGLGFRGALYAWESADTGEETTPPFAVRPDGQVIPIRCGTQEQHISADVAYATWQYWLATGDAAFLRDAGAEIILETARFWASRATLEEDGRFHIRGVIGPDEYHEGVDDNAYTNGLARWNLRRALEVVDLLRERWPDRWADLRDRLGVSADEPDRWRDVADRLTLRVDPASGIIEQFEGYFALEPIDLAAFTPRAAPMDVVLGHERIQRTQVIKQADVVMLLALLWDELDPAQRLASFRYYEPRCGHGSSLSPAIHALVAARLGDMSLAETYFHEAAAIDLDDTLGNAALGIHIAALGGLWQAVVFGFAGLSLRADGLSLDPRLPETWQSLRFPVQWRRRKLTIQARRDPPTVAATLERGRPMVLHIRGVSRQITTGETMVCPLPDADPRARGTIP